MSTGAITVVEAVEWREPAPGGGSQAQIFRLSDGRFAVVKFPENPQGEIVLANEFLSCRLAELLALPINRAVLASIDERLIRLPRQNGQMLPTFSAGIRCGMIRFEMAEGAQPADVLAGCDNSDELHAVAVFEQLVCRGDGRQLLMYPNPNGAKGKQFAAYDYGFAFGGSPIWSAATVGAMAPAALPPTDPFTGQAYPDGTNLAPIVQKLRTLTTAQVDSALAGLYPPRWGITENDIDALARVLDGRARSLVIQFDQHYASQ